MRFPFLRFAAVLAALAPLAMSGPARAQLYGLSSSVPGTVYTINTATGTATAVVNLTGVDTTAFPGLEFLGNTLYATNVFVGGTRRFGTIDLTTGAFTPINEQGGSGIWYALSAGPAAGLLYTVNALPGSGLPLLSITPGGVITFIGNTGRSIRGLAFDSNNGVLYGVDASQLFRINTATGAATLVGNLAIGSTFYGLAYDPVGDVLYLNRSSATGGLSSLYTVNRTTGAATLVGSNGAVALNGIDGLAFRVAPTQAAVPEPGTLALLLVGSLTTGAGFLRRRRA